MFTASPEIDWKKFYIDGVWDDPLGSDTRAVVNPATEETVAEISMGSPDDVARAIRAARTAFPAYADVEPKRRIELLRAAQQLYDERYESIAQAITAEMAAPITFSRNAQALTGKAHLETYIAALENFDWVETLESGDRVFREPVGVVGIITPWNWPMNQLALKLFAALGVGCTVALKPSEFTPLSAMILVQILHDAGFPPGTVNLVNGDGPSAGRAIATSPDIDLVSFTGSTRSGISVARDAADTVKRVSLELGGKAPSIVFADADLESAIRTSIDQCFGNAGQSCVSGARLLVERSVYDRAVEIAREHGLTKAVGDPFREGSHMGPVINAVQFEHIQRLIQAGLDEGAELVTGGPGRPEGVERGYFVRPTIFRNARNDMVIAREEIFGPVLLMMPFETEVEAIEIANDTPYGLCAFIHSGDPARIERVAGKLRVGTVNVNGGACDWGTPFGGYKMSGIGREGGRFGLEEFTEIKAVSHYTAAE
jgi:aldehyde dehydrogenase (NAD+)